MNRIHIVGLSPRTGTTLMAELMSVGFYIDGYVKHEFSIFKRPTKDFEVFCTKQPKDIESMWPLLWVDRNLWAICMERDPRDVIVSQHPTAPNQYWTNLRIWKKAYTKVKKLRNHPRFLTISYEELVTNPNKVQDQILEKIPFLKKRAAFSEYHNCAKPSDAYISAMKGIRPISSASVGSWLKHKPRLAAQLSLHGSISRELVEMGYESDDSWLSELEIVEPDYLSSAKPETLSLYIKIRHIIGHIYRTTSYVFGITKRVNVKIEALDPDPTE